MVAQQGPGRSRHLANQHLKIRTSLLSCAQRIAHQAYSPYPHDLTCCLSLVQNMQRQVDLTSQNAVMQQFDAVGGVGGGVSALGLSLKKDDDADMDFDEEEEI